MVSAQKLSAVLIIFLISVPFVFAVDLLPDEEKQPIVVIVRQGSTAITDSLSAKSAAEKPSVLAKATDTKLKDERYPYLVAGSEVTILKYRCTSEICGYWISCSRAGKEVKTNSPVWISPPPYEVVVSETYDSKTNIQTVTLREDPKAAAEEVLRGYCDRQPLGKAITGTPA